VLRSRLRRARSGVTLAELLVALTLSGIVLGTATSSLMRQQRTAAVVNGSAAVAAQLRAATGALAAELGPLGSGSGDLVAEEASDTTIGLRTLVTSDASCDNAVGGVTFAGADGELVREGGHVPHAGDSLWWYVDAATGWRGREIIASGIVTAPCLLTGMPARASWRVQVAGADSIPFGAFLRVTRRSRYAFYRSGDGSWQLGLQEWVPETARLAPPQPVAGPFVVRAQGDRSGFRYLDRNGAEIPSTDVAREIARVARVRMTVVMRVGTTSASGRGWARDSVDVALQPAGAR
jgi:prepilin-type N-terminal cleavage/methylation domain-containing protein